MIRIIATKHLIAVQGGFAVYERAGCHISNSWGILHPGQILGTIQGGSNLPIDDLDIVQEWRDLQEFASTARK